MSRIILQYNVCPGDRVQMSGSIVSGEGDERVLPLEPRVCACSSLLAISEQITAALENTMPLLVEDDNQGARSHMKKLQGLAAELGTMVLPESVVRILQQDRAIKYIVFRHDPLLNGVPFHAAYLDDDFICFSYGVAKQLLHPEDRISSGNGAAAQNAAYEVFSLIDPDESLLPDQGDAFSVFQAQWMEDARLAERIDFTDARVSRPIRPQDALVNFHNADFVLLYCHHLYDRENPSESGFLLGKEPDGSSVVLTARAVLDHFSASIRAPKIVFSLSCDSGITAGWEACWPETPSVYGMADALQRSGVPHYVGSLCRIPAAHTPGVVAPFFRCLAEGDSVGEAMRQARMDLRSKPEDVLDGGTAIGLALVLYGDPLKSYFCHEGHRVDSRNTVECLARDENTGHECGKTVCPKDAGFGQRRCAMHRRGQIARCSAGHEVESRDEMNICGVNDCQNTYCAQCPGSADSLCWFHFSHSGHRIVSQHARKTCVGSAHPHEQRTVVPTDDGWMRGLCDECFVKCAAEKLEQQEPSCSHCGRIVNDSNPWKGACRICGQRTCLNCAAWHEQTFSCSNPSTDRKKDRWIAALNTRQAEDADVAAPNQLAAMEALAENFNGAIETNLFEYKNRRGKLPFIAMRMHEIVFPHPAVARVVKVQEFDGCMPCSERNAPADGDWPGSKPGADKTDMLWQDLPESWIRQVQKLNRALVYRLAPNFGRQVIVVAAKLLPIRFEAGRGPSVVKAEQSHLDTFWDALGEALENEGLSSSNSDIWVAVFSPAGWSENVGAQLSRNKVLSLVEHKGDTFITRHPPLAGKPKFVRDFARVIEPLSRYQRLQSIKDWVVGHLRPGDHALTWDQVQREVRNDTDIDPAPQEVAEVFAELQDEGAYQRCVINKREALRPATAKERSSVLLRRRWVDLAAALAGLAASMVVWHFRSIILPFLPHHWGAGMSTTIVCVALSWSLGRGIRYSITGEIV